MPIRVLVTALALAVPMMAEPRAATADPEPALAALEQALPTGWSLLVGNGELVIRHDRAVYATDDSATAPASAALALVMQHDGPLIDLELRYRVEPRWSAERLAAARAANAGLVAHVAAERARLRIDAMPIVQGVRRATTADERARLAELRKTARLAASNAIALPTCELGTLSVFVGAETYAQLALPLDPPQAATDAHRIQALVAQRCVAE